MKTIFLLILLTIFLFPNKIYSQEVFSPIKKDQPAKFDGLVISIEAATKLMSDIKICENKIENAKLIENKINELKLEFIKNLNNEEINNIKLTYDNKLSDLNKNIGKLEESNTNLYKQNEKLEKNIERKDKLLKIASYSIIFLSAATIGEFLYIYYK